MNRKEFIDKSIESLKAWTIEGQENPFEDCMFEEIEEYLDELITSAVEDKWISISERCPMDEELDKEMLICFRNKFIIIAKYSEDMSGITHWQPLPNPPKQ